MEVILAQPRGFCAGVVRAIDIVELALDVHGAPVYVFHEIVHNQHVVESLRARGAIFVDALADVPPGAVTVFSAHGVSTTVVKAANERKLKIIDATCPLVTKVHLQAQRYSKGGHAIVIIGHAGHEEVEGTMGSVTGPVFLVSTVADVDTLDVPNPEAVAYVTQTTLSLDDTREVIRALKQRFPAIKGPEVDDICYATQNRQNAVRDLAQKVDVLLVVGATNSSNSNRLVEVGEQNGIASYLIGDETQIKPEWFANNKRVGVTAGASAPEALVLGVVKRLASLGATDIHELDGVRETTVFRLPKSLLLEKAKKDQQGTVA